MPVRAAFLAALLAAAAPAAAVEAGERAPAFVAPALEPGGSSVSLEALRGRVVYVDFWASWCVPCRQSMPVLDALARRHGPRGFAVVGVNKDATAADAQRFLRRVPVGFALASDADDAVAKAFGVKAMPSGYLVDRAGVVRRVHRGFDAGTAAALEREIEELLGR
jgi:cytochrome c biogenesis protein CcmG/thiol:disulfide interchange protein DsbE